MKVYNRKLSAAEVTTNYTAAFVPGQGVTDGLVYELRIDEGQGSLLRERALEQHSTLSYGSWSYVPNPRLGQLGSSALAQTVFCQGGYRFGFNGMHRDDEIAGRGNALDFGARMYDSRLGRWMSVDPLAAKAPGWTPFRGFFNNPISFSDPNGKFEISEPLAKQYPNLKPALQNIAAELQKPENADKLNTILKYGEFKNAEQFISLFSDNNKTVKLEAGNLLAVNPQKNGLVGDQGLTVTSTSERDDKSGMLKSTVTIDAELLRLLNDQDLSEGGKEFANLLFESTLLHELIHTGDNQDKIKNNRVPLQFTLSSNNEIQTNLRTKEVGKFAEQEIYGEDVDINNNKEVKENVINGKEKK